MKITILDGGTTNPGDISWGELNDLGELCVFYDTPKDEIIERAFDSEILISNRITYDPELLEKLPNLKYIGALSTGFNSIDLKATRERGIEVCNVPEYCVLTVAQMTFALIMELCNHCHSHSDIVKAGKWNESIEFGQTKAPFFELQNKTLGIVGYGAIGKSVANIAKAFGMNVLAYSKSPKEIETVSLEEIFEKCEIISLHCALNEQTKGMINMNLFKRMKKEALLVNTARGGLINEEDLIKALEMKLFAGLGVDVMCEEPPKENHELFKFENCIITPHIAWASKEARQRLVGVVTENLKAFLNGNPQNVVNK